MEVYPQRQRSTWVPVLIVLGVLFVMIMSSIHRGWHDRLDRDDVRIVFAEKGVSFSELVAAEIVIAAYSDLNLIADYALQLVDAGVFIFITAPESSRLEMSETLGIPLEGRPTYNDLPRQGTYVAKILDIYVWGNHYTTRPTAAPDIDYFIDIAVAAYDQHVRDVEFIERLGE